MSIVDKIKSEITQTFYQQNFPNDGQRFVAWYMRNIHRLNELQTKDAITDGANDKQIDGVYIDEDEQKIFVVQGKFYQGETVNAEPVREVISAWSQFSDLSKMQENANEKLKKKIFEISNALQSDDYCICFELITTSTFSSEAQKDIESFQTKLNENDEDTMNFNLEVVDKDNLENKYNMIVEQSNPILNHEIKFESGKYLKTQLNSTNVIIAAIPLKDCIKFPGIQNGTLFQKNVRQSLGINNTVNKKIKKTLNDPDKSGEFFFFHNGITAICKEIKNIGDDTFKFIDINVVNGCQSLNTIISCSENVRKRDNAYVLVRFYEIPQRDRADSISINTNTQSAVKARDLRSNSKQVLKLKRAYEQTYPQGFFSSKRGEVTPADKDKNYTIELSALGKQLMAWFVQRPNLSYGETKIFDKYFAILFKNEYKPEDVYSLHYFMSKIMRNWEADGNPLDIDDVILTMKAYAPFHLLFGISAIFAKANNQTGVPSPSECLRIVKQHEGLEDTIIQMSVQCLNNALQQESESCRQFGRTFIPQNWIKNKSSISGIQTAIINLFTFSPDAKKLKEWLAMKPGCFTYRVQGDD